MLEPKVIVIGNSGIGSVAALMLAIKESQEEMILVKDTEELREFITNQKESNTKLLIEALESESLKSTAITIIAPELDPYMNAEIIRDTKPFYHNITNRRKKR